MNDIVLDRRHLPLSAHPEANTYLNAVARAALHEILEVEDFAGRVDVKASRSPSLLAGFLPSEIEALEATDAVFIVGAVVSVAAGDAVRPGMRCRFYGWEWTLFMRARKPGDLWKVRGLGGMKKHNRENCQPFGTLRAAILAYDAAVRERREWGEPVTDEWIGEWICRYAGVWEQEELF